MPPSAVLIVEDDAVQLAALSRAFAQRGVAVSLADSAETALGVLVGTRFAAVVSDFELPEHPGTWLLERAREVDPGAYRVLVSGFPVERFAEELASGVVDSFFRKPLSLDCIATIHDALRARRCET